MFQRKIAPFGHDPGHDDFDDLSKIVGSDGSDPDSRKRSSKIVPVDADSEAQVSTSSSVKRKPRRGKLSSSKKKKKDTEAISNFSSQQMLSWKDLIYLALLSRQSIYLGAPFFLIAMLSCGILDLFTPSFRLDLSLTLALAGSVSFQHFPAHVIRPQLLISILTLCSFAWDVYIMHWSDLAVVKVFGSLLVIGKMGLFVAFLRRTKGASRVRRYLHRRFRLFGPVFSLPRRLMREVRSRFLALLAVHLLTVVMYVILLIIFFIPLQYSSIYLPSYINDNLPILLSVKIGTQTLCSLGLLIDTDLKLCFWTFGLLAFYPNYIRRYIADVKSTLGGEPLSFSFHAPRFFIWQVVKGLDFIIGLGLWSLLLPALFHSHQEAGIRAFCSVLAFTLFVSDVWAGLVLVRALRWLLKRKRAHTKLLQQETGQDPASDDSELEDFKLRDESSEEDEEKGTEEKGELSPLLGKNNANKAESLLRRPQRANVAKVKIVPLIDAPDVNSPFHPEERQEQHFTAAQFEQQWRQSAAMEQHRLLSLPIVNYFDFSDHDRVQELHDAMLGHLQTREGVTIIASGKRGNEALFFIIIANTRKLCELRLGLERRTAQVRIAVRSTGVQAYSNESDDVDEVLRWIRLDKLSL